MGHGQKVQHCEWRVSIHAPAARLMSACWPCAPSLIHVDQRQRACAGVQDVKPTAQGPASHPPCEVGELFRSDLKIARYSDYGLIKISCKFRFYDCETVNMKGSVLVRIVADKWRVYTFSVSGFHYFEGRFPTHYGFNCLERILAAANRLSSIRAIYFFWLRRRIGDRFLSKSGCLLSIMWAKP